MAEVSTTQEASGGQAIRRSRTRRVGRVCARALGLVVVLITVLAVGVGALLLRLANGPLVVGGLSERVAAELGARLGPGYSVVVGGSTIERVETSLRLSLAGLSVRDSSGKAVFAAPRASVAVAIAPLLVGSVKPTSVDLYDVQLRLEILENGALAVSAGADPIVVMGGGAKVEDDAPNNVPLTTARLTTPAAAAVGAVLGLLTNPDSPAQRMERVALSGGRLTVDDKLSGRSTVFDNVELGFNRRRGGKADLAFAANGPDGRFRARASAASEPGERALEVEVRDLGFDELALAAGMRDPKAYFDTPISAKILLGLDNAGALRDAAARFNLGAGYIYVRDRDFEPLFIDEATGGLRWDAASGKIEIEPTQWASGETQLTVAGQISAPAGDGEPWVIAGSALPGSVLGPERQSDMPVPMDNTRLSVSVYPRDHRLTLDSLAVANANANVELTGDFDWGPNTRRARLAVVSGKTSARAALRLWPNFIAPPVHAWLLEHLDAGLVERGKLTLDFDGPAIDNALLKRPPDDDRLRVDFAIAGATLRFLPGAPPIQGLEAVGHTTGHTALVNLKRGTLEGSPGHKVAMSDGTFSVADTTLKPAPAVLNTRLVAPIDAFVDVLSRDAFRPFVGSMGDTSQVKGQMDGRVTVDLLLDDKPRPDDTKVSATATITDFGVDRLIGKERFDQGQLALTIDKNGMRAVGGGKLFGAPAQIEFKKQGPAALDVNLSFAIDDAARARVAPAFATGISGPIAARVTSSIAGKDPAPAHVELDFTKAGFDNPLPGLVKAAGRPAKASFRLETGPDGARLDQFAFDSSAGASARGSIDLDTNGNLRVARLTQARVSPGDDLRVDAEQGRDALRLTVSGAAVDARPFLRGVFGGGGGQAADAPANASTAGHDMDIDLKTTLVTGFNKQALSNVDLKLSRRGGAMKSLRLRGMSGRSEVVVSTTPDKDGAPVVNINASDGGALLSFVDLYQRMEGGRMRASVRILPKGVDGSVFVSDFVVRDEPALRRLVSEGAPNGDQQMARKIDTAAAPFQRLSATFSKQGGDLHVVDGLLYGTQIGIKLAGSLDYARNRVDMSGTFVPAYGLNNLFTQIPLFGPILTGGSHEGLFAVNFRVSGPATGPSLIVNPLSAIAPGFLRKIFGVGGPVDPGAPSADAPASIPKQ